MLQQYMNTELPDVQAGFRKGGGTRDQIANIRRIIEKAREFKKKLHDADKHNGVIMGLEPGIPECEIKWA